ncbi:polyketide synthase [Burkholderia ubonensis]|uniref:Polyketide synthase n=1 Tax=Burkholderia ubonensis TaxID=101571 RepID=A0AB73GAV8_9BURK|nr:acyl carrier protein [Burkholderia ubonensis]KVC69712.1 polyketide synthase [Burkholderia ubonensis]KVC77439.1 polyketide synthase [Burkholderia ubonensis]KVD30796.1 polyketide synthase [Burkholderia ubonensis]KVG73747.1 polyketide synthase [Burkholderia ubonensis]KVH16929.1 polyketide synthase [Burkholderia ubonensis]
MKSATSNAAEHDTKSHEDILDWMIGYLAARLRTGRGSIDVDKQFIDYGLDSADAMKMVGDLEDYVGFELSPSLPYQYPTIDALAQALADLRAGR